MFMVWAMRRKRETRHTKLPGFQNVCVQFSFFVRVWHYQTGGEGRGPALDLALVTGIGIGIAYDTRAQVTNNLTQNMSGQVRSGRWTDRHRETLLLVLNDYDDD